MNCDEFNFIATQLEFLKINFDEVLYLLLLSSLPSNWDTLVTMVANTMRNKFKLNDVVASLLNEETQKATNQLSSDINQVLAIGERGRSLKQGQSSNTKEISKLKKGQNYKVKGSLVGIAKR